MPSSFRKSFTATVLATFAAACGGSDATAPTVYPPATLNQALAELSIPALAAGGASYVDMGSTTPALNPTNCPYSAAVQSFVCAPISESGLTVNQSFTLLTASGAKQGAFDPTSTDAVRANTSVGGTLVDQGTTLTVTGQQEITLSGLVSGPHKLNGTSTLSLAGTFDDGTTSYPANITVGTTIANLVLPVNATGSDQVWPTSGTITIDVTGTIGPVSVSQVRTTITFSGTSTVNVSVTGGGLSQSCKVDLAVSAPTCE